MQIESYNAAVDTAAFLPQDWIGVLKLTGPDRIDWLQGMISNDVEKLVPGQGCYAAHLNAQGKLIAQIVVLIESDAILLITERASASRLAEVFDKLIIMEDVRVENLSAAFVSLLVLGPKGQSVLEAWFGEPLQLNEEFQHREISGYAVVRTGCGYEVWMPSELLAEATGALKQRGAVAIDASTWNVLRVEAGLPLYAVDIDETTTLPEIGERGIRYDKGCYIGQEVVAKIKYLGHVNRRLMGLVCDGETPPQPQSMIQSGGKDVGYITSSVKSPRVGKPIALGFVSRAAAVAGNRVDVVGEFRVSAVVSELPFIPASPISD